MREVKGCGVREVNGVWSDGSEGSGVKEVKGVWSEGGARE